MHHNKTCILTDSSALFPSLEFEGRSLVHILPLGIQVRDQVVPDSPLLPKATGFHNVIPPEAKTVAPSTDEFCQAYNQLALQYDAILAILPSSHLLDAVQNAMEAAEKARVNADIRIIDSQTCAAGLGFLVQAAAEAISKGFDRFRVYALIRGMITHIYAILCLPNLMNLAKAGKIDPEQSLVAEMLNLAPVFVMENGRLIPVQKARNSRQIVDIFEEFVAEFDQPVQVAITQGSETSELEIKTLKDRLSQNQPRLAINMLSMSPALRNLFGPKCLAIFTLEKVI